MTAIKSGPGSHMEFFIPGPAYPKHRVGNGKNEAEKWSELIISYTKDLPMVGGPCEMKIVYQLPPDRFTLGSPYGQDLDNLTKRLLDSLARTILKDVDSRDGCICKIEISKKVAFDPEMIGTSVEVEQLHELDKEDRFLYFAYGSNMHYERLKKRADGLEKRAIAYLPRYRLRTNKRSEDEAGNVSGKANIEKSQSNSDLVWGVVWSIAKSERCKLDNAEGYHENRHDSHYKPIEVIVFDNDGLPWKALTYIACEGRTIQGDLPLYEWYYEYMTRGANGNNLPLGYQVMIFELEHMDDPDSVRNCKEMKIVKEWPL